MHVSAEGSSRRKGISGTAHATIRPLSQNTIQIISRVDAAAMWNYGQFGTVSVSELLSALGNFRKLTREADRARLQDGANEAKHEEFEILHSIHAKNGRDMTVRVILALIEKAVNALTGSSSQFYAYAALSSYSKQVDVAFELMELGGNEVGARAIADHLPL